MVHVPWEMVSLKQRPRSPANQATVRGGRPARSRRPRGGRGAGCRQQSGSLPWVVPVVGSNDGLSRQVCSRFLSTTPPARLRIDRCSPIARSPLLCQNSMAERQGFTLLDLRSSLRVDDSLDSSAEESTKYVVEAETRCRSTVGVDAVKIIGYWRRPCRGQHPETDRTGIVDLRK